MAKDSGHAPELCDEFRTASRKVHSISDALVNSKLLVLFCNRELYGLAIAKFYIVIRVIEEELLKHAGHPDVADVASILPPLFRTSGMEEDLTFYLGDAFNAKSQSVGGPSSHLVNTHAVQQYCQHVRDLSARDPVLLLAHSYTQHMAIMAGGQIIRRMARKHMLLPEDQGTAMYEFVERSPNTLKNEFKAAMNRLAARLTPERRQQMVGEHIRAFEFNNRIVREFPVGWLNTVRAVSTQLLPSLAQAVAARPLVLAAVLLITLGPVVWFLAL